MTQNIHNTTLLDFSGKRLDEVVRLLKKADADGRGIVPTGISGTYARVVFGEKSVVRLLTVLESTQPVLLKGEEPRELSLLQTIAIESANKGNTIAEKLLDELMTAEGVSADLANAKSPEVAAHALARSSGPRQSYAVGEKNLHLGGILPASQSIPSPTIEEIKGCQLIQIENSGKRPCLKISYRDSGDVNAGRSPTPHVRFRWLVVPDDFRGLAELCLGVASRAEADIQCSHYVNSTGFRGAKAKENFVLESLTFVPNAREQLDSMIRSLAL